MNDIRFAMLWQDKNAKQITEFFREKGIAAHYKGTGFEGTGLMLPMQAPTIFVDENKIDEAIAARRYEPYHKAITNYQRQIARTMEPGDSMLVKWPIPKGNICPTKH